MNLRDENNDRNYDDSVDSCGDTDAQQRQLLEKVEAELAAVAGELDAECPPELLVAADSRIASELAAMRRDARSFLSWRIAGGALAAAVAIVFVLVGVFGGASRAQQDFSDDALVVYSAPAETSANSDDELPLSDEDISQIWQVLATTPAGTQDDSDIWMSGLGFYADSDGIVALDL